VIVMVQQAIEKRIGPYTVTVTHDEFPELSVLSEYIRLAGFTYYNGNPLSIYGVFAPSLKIGRRVCLTDRPAQIWVERKFDHEEEYGSEVAPIVFYLYGDTESVLNAEAEIKAAFGV